MLQEILARAKSVEDGMEEFKKLSEEPKTERNNGSHAKVKISPLARKTGL